MTAKITSPQTKQIEHFLADALGTANLSKAGAQRVIECGDELSSRVTKLITELSIDTGETASQRAARKIMGTNFLGIPEVIKHFGAIDPAARLALQNVPFDAATLKVCASTHILVADLGLGVMDVRGQVDRSLFFSYKDWYIGYEFAQRTEPARWRLIRKTPVDGSLFKTWADQQELLEITDEVPSARQIIYLMILNYLTTGERLFESVSVRTCDVDSDGDRVNVGDFDRDLVIDGCWHDDDLDCDLGLAAARK